MSKRTARRLAIALTALFAVAEIAGLALQFVTGRPEDEFFGLPGKVVAGLLFLAWSLTGAVIISRQPANAVGWAISGIALQWALTDLTFGYATYALDRHQGSLPGGVFAAVAYNSLFFVAEFLIVMLFLLFPDGRALSPRWRLVGWIAAGASFVLFLGTFLSAGPVDRFDVENQFGILPELEFVGWIAFLLLFGTVIASILSLILRLRRARGELRQQMRWFVYAAALLPTSFAFFFFGPSRVFGAVGALLLLAAIIGIPAAAAISIFKYRLYDIDIVIGKTVIVGILAAFATAVYLAIVVGVGTLVGSRGERQSVVLAVVATAIVAVAFQPVRAWAQRLANRLVYGERATPYDVLSDFSDRLSDTFDSQDLLPRMARMLVDATGAARADVWLRIGDQLQPAGTWPAVAVSRAPVPLEDGQLPSIDGADLAAPVRHDGDLLGAVSVSKRPGEQPSPIEEKLVEDLAAQAGLVLSNVRLIEELRASRQRLVAAHDEERRKLERNLHDGAQQQLVALAVKQRLAEGLIDRDPDRARTLMADLQSDTTDALETLRDLARGIYPPILADRGLMAALEAQTRKAPVRVILYGDGIGRYERDVEAGIYFCCLEALQNVAKYASHATATIRLIPGDGMLTFFVADDGPGFDVDGPRGSGLQGMSDRLEALGGILTVSSVIGTGTTIEGRLPVRPGLVSH